MADDPDPERLRRLDERIARVRAQTAPEPAVENHHRQAQQAWRMVIELVSGLGIGFGIGYGLDVLFGTLPFLLVLFTLLGFAAGVNVMIRTARELQQGHAADTPADDRKADTAAGTEGE